eukprot:COSAG04_NODE_14603_length_562_cov_0.630670_1_plen_57_part_10
MNFITTFSEYTKLSRESYYKENVEHADAAHPHPVVERMLDCFRKRFGGRGRRLYRVT